MAARPDRILSLGEEIANAVTHGIGTALAITGLVVVVAAAVRASDPRRVAAASIYGVSLVLLYLASTLYHALTHPGAKQVFRRLDHAFIYLLIAGTYTPFTLVSLRDGPWGWGLFAITWVFAATGIVLAAVFGPRRFKKLSLVLYATMGWSVVVALGPTIRAIGAGQFGWLLAGGLAYTLGILFYVLRTRWSHTVWHGFVLAGSVLQFIPVFRVLAP
jgi:hemolysin III